MDVKESRLISGHLHRKKYIEAMEQTEYGWKPSENFPKVGCPSDLYFVSVNDEPSSYECVMDCEDCWKYVLKNKKW